MEIDFNTINSFLNLGLAGFISIYLLHYITIKLNSKLDKLTNSIDKLRESIEKLEEVVRYGNR